MTRAVEFVETEIIIRRFQPDNWGPLCHGDVFRASWEARTLLSDTWIVEKAARARGAQIEYLEDTEEYVEGGKIPVSPRNNIDVGRRSDGTRCSL